MIQTLIRMEERLDRAVARRRLVLGIGLCAAVPIAAMGAALSVRIPDRAAQWLGPINPLADDEHSTGAQKLSQFLTLCVVTTLVLLAGGMYAVGFTWIERASQDAWRATHYCSMWKDQPQRWEKARLEFLEYLARHRPEELTRDELEAVCCGLIRCIDTPTLLDSSLPVLYEDAFGQPLGDEPDLPHLRFRLHRYRTESQQRRPEKPDPAQTPEQSA